jgi:hypothetical protein
MRYCSEESVAIPFSTIVKDFMHRGIPGLKAALHDHYRDIKLRFTQRLAVIETALTKAKAEAAELEKRLTAETSRANEAEAKSEATLQCVVCKEAPCDTLLMPCNHLVTCAKCVCNRTVKKCPVCRNDIRGKIKVYT